MLNKLKSVFVLGAGSSFPYKLPLGEALYYNIWHDFSRDVESYYVNKLHSKNPRHIEKVELSKSFRADLGRVNKISIDKFLNLNEKYSEIGNISIVSEIIKSELSSTIPSVRRKIDGDWISYLWAQMVKDLDTIDKLKDFPLFNKVSIITFNYDRVFEHIFFENLYGLLMNNGFTRIDVTKIIKQIPIIHVYGKIGYLPWEKEIETEKVYDEDSKILSYGFTDGNYPAIIGEHFSDLIEIIYEDRKDNSDIDKAHDLINESDNVYFLGFGFDTMNIDILNLKTLLKTKNIYATTMGATKNEMIKIKSALNLDSDTKHFVDTDCLGLLREHLK